MSVMRFSVSAQLSLSVHALLAARHTVSLPDQRSRDGWPRPLALSGAFPVVKVCTLVGSLTLSQCFHSSLAAKSKICTHFKSSFSYDVTKNTLAIPPVGQPLPSPAAKSWLHPFVVSDVPFVSCAKLLFATCIRCTSVCADMFISSIVS